jgi:hypothetical protein
MFSLIGRARLRTEGNTQRAEPVIERSSVKSSRTWRERMARPVGKWFVSNDLSSLRKRIRPFGIAPLAKMEIRASWSS